MITKKEKDILAIYGATLISTKTDQKITATSNDLYYYETYVGKSSISVPNGDCAYVLSQDKSEAALVRGPMAVKSFHIATIIRGYMPENKRCSLGATTYLPYINGCSTRQVFPPERPGDPTMQMLYMPPNSSEQFHHIHSTTRVVYVLDGQGKAVIGLKNKNAKVPLKAGDSIILNKMCPHHFETQNSHLRVLPLHIFSTVGDFEFNHPMFLGTHRVD